MAKREGEEGGMAVLLGGRGRGGRRREEEGSEREK
jgi:hypothetical protein